MFLSNDVYKLIRVAFSNLNADVEIDENSITIDLNQDRPLVEVDVEILEDTFKRLRLVQSCIYRSAGYHYYIREEAFG